VVMMILTWMLLAVCAALLVAGALRLRAVNLAARRLREGDLTVRIPSSSLPLVRETAAHLAFLGRSISDLQRMEEYAQKSLAYEKKELAHFLEKENLARQMKRQLVEIQEAYRTISTLNLDLEEKNRSLNDAINRLSALNQISRVLTSSHDRRQVDQTMISLPMALLGAEIGHLLLLDHAAGELVLTHSQGLKEEGRSPRRIPVGTGVAGWVARHRKPLLVPDFSRQDLFTPRSTLGYERHTAISVPLMIKDELIGIISMINREDGRAFTEEDKTLLVTIASEAAMALHNLLLLEKVQSNYFSMVKALIAAVEAKDIYTRGHSERVTQYSMLIAEQMNLPPHRRDIIQKAGFLHDIGKITVELSILNKPAFLDEEERGKIRLHPMVGYRILQPIDFEDDVKVCILQHHERLDGTGYPNGCPAAELILESRILSVADAFDAMTTKRPYREAVSVSDAIIELERCAGSQFDPEVVQAFKLRVESMLARGTGQELH
jgi:putative nucleotidyltransferase with HDIG domain